MSVMGLPSSSYTCRGPWVVNTKAPIVMPWFAEIPPMKLAFLEKDARPFWTHLIFLRFHELFSELVRTVSGDQHDLPFRLQVSGCPLDIRLRDLEHGHLLLPHVCEPRLNE